MRVRNDLFFILKENIISVKRDFFEKSPYFFLTEKTSFNSNILNGYTQIVKMSYKSQQNKNTQHCSGNHPSYFVLTKIGGTSSADIFTTSFNMHLNENHNSFCDFPKLVQPPLTTPAPTCLNANLNPI